MWSSTCRKAAIGALRPQSRRPPFWSSQTRTGGPWLYVLDTSGQDEERREFSTEGGARAGKAGRSLTDRQVPGAIMRNKIPRETLMDAPEHEPYYWSEADYTQILSPEERQLQEMMESGQTTVDDNGQMTIEVSDEMFEYFQNVQQKKALQKQVPKKEFNFDDDDDDLAANLPFPNILDELANDGPEFEPPPDYNRIAPLKISGDTPLDLINDLMNHPTHFGTISYESEHPEMNRMPVPISRRFLKKPPLSFVKAYTRFIFVTGLPSVMPNGTVGDFDSELSRHEIQKTVSGLFSVGSDAVFPVDLNSAFIGFATPNDQRRAMTQGPSQETIKAPVLISKYVPEEGDETVAEEDLDKAVLLQGLPAGLQTSQLAETLFPEGTPLAENYGKLSPRDVRMKLLDHGELSPSDVRMRSQNSAVVILGSAEMADSAVSSASLRDRLVELGQHTVRYTRARRQLRSTTQFIMRGVPKKELGRKLIVDGDMPTRDFFLSHSSVIHLKGLDPAVTKEDIAAFFQPFCHAPRDILGSTEFVTYEKDLPSGNAFVGFDEFGESERFHEKFESGRICAGLLGKEEVSVKQVREKTKFTMERRPTRQIDELLDDLTNWERHVDPADVQKLLDYGITKETLDDTFRVYRYKNHSFAALDQAKKDESVDPNLERGEAFGNLVRSYIANLISCLATEEDPGEIFQGLFAPDETLDFAILDRNQARVEKAQRRRRELEE